MTTLQQIIFSPERVNAPEPLPTIWGLDPIQLHDYYWAARGVQVVRLGESSTVVPGAELYLLTDDATLVLCRVRSLVDVLSWVDPTVLIARVHETRRRNYQEHAITGENHTLQRFQRTYAHDYHVVRRVAFTADPDIARAWQAMGDTAYPWRTMRRHIPNARRETASIRGHIYRRYSLPDLARFATDVVRLWTKPSLVINRASPHKIAKVWADQDSTIDDGAYFVDRVWVGAGRVVSSKDLVVGPAILWDDPLRRPNLQTIQWQDLEPNEANAGPQRALPRHSFISRALKRGFDIAFSILAIVLTFPIYPLVMLSIWIEDGRPFWFVHARESMGGKEFPCLKFRSMRKDAEKIRAALAHKNQADGPQFFMKNDPRLTRVGRFIRKTNIDELPQFFNVLLGHMSVVGPRPSPRRENQFCPAWREARLAVRPGITGLWQVNRTRIRGADFQEWIKYDIEYVEHQSWHLDIKIIGKTFSTIFKGLRSS